MCIRDSLEGSKKVISNAAIVGTDTNYDVDSDFYKFEISKTGTKEDKINLSFKQFDGDLDLILYDTYSKVISSSTSTSSNEFISLENISPGSYVLEVKAPYNSSGYIFNPIDVGVKYEIDIKAPNSNLSADKYEPNNNFNSSYDLGSFEGRKKIESLSIHHAGDKDIFDIELLYKGADKDEVSIDYFDKFGNLKFDSAKVKTNSAALVAFGTALASMPTDELGTLKLDKSFVTNLKNLSMVDGQGLNTVQTSLANIVNTPNLKTTLADLNDLGKNYKNVEDLAEAMEDLADAMKEVNQQSKNTSRGRNAGRGNNNETSSASASIIAGSGTGSGNDQLNSIMSRIEILLSEMRDTDRKILTATQNNAGNVAIALGN